MTVKKLVTMKEARERAGKTLEWVAAETRISYSAARALEKGLGLNYAPAIKHRVSDLLGQPFFSMWPEEAEKLQGLTKEMKSTHRLEMLKDYLPEIKFRNESTANAVLKAADLDELDEIFHSGVTPEEALATLNALAKKYRLPAPEIK